MNVIRDYDEKVDLWKNLTEDVENALDRVRIDTKTRTKKLDT